MPNQVNPTCSTCGQGALIKKKKYRMSGPAVAIGYLLLIPSIIGMLIGGLFLFATGATAGGSSAAIDSAARKRLTDAGVAPAVVEQVMNGTYTRPAGLEVADSKQQRIITDTQFSIGASKLGTGAGTVIAGGLSIGVLIMSFIGGLLGWLLVMKKWVLQCNRCTATVAAS